MLIHTHIHTIQRVRKIGRMQFFSRALALKVLRRQKFHKHEDLNKKRIKKKCSELMLSRMMTVTNTNRDSREGHTHRGRQSERGETETHAHTHTYSSFIALIPFSIFCLPLVSLFCMANSLFKSVVISVWYIFIASCTFFVASERRRSFLFAADDMGPEAFFCAPGPF